ncbi:MAG: hypothetical protein WAK17_24200 [Candidatus Nitrosopolaris sp.]|jgi:hypothetical protein
MQIDLLNEEVVVLVCNDSRIVFFIVGPHIENTLDIFDYYPEQQGKKSQSKKNFMLFGGCNGPLTTEPNKKIVNLRITC